MARSTCVFVVMVNGEPVAGFTVKHELITWLERHPEVTLAQEWRVWRCGDGLWQDSPRRVSVVELMG